MSLFSADARSDPGQDRLHAGEVAAGDCVDFFQGQGAHPVEDELVVVIAETIEFVEGALLGQTSIGLVLHGLLARPGAAGAVEFLGGESILGQIVDFG